MANHTPDLESIVKVARKFSRPYRIDRGRGFRLKDIDPGDTAHLGAEDKPHAQEAEQWEAAGAHCSGNERRADEASRDVESWLKCRYMRDRRRTATVDVKP